MRVIFSQTVNCTRHRRTQNFGWCKNREFSENFHCSFKNIKLICCTMWSGKLLWLLYINAVCIVFETILWFGPPYGDWKFSQELPKNRSRCGIMAAKDLNAYKVRSYQPYWYKYKYQLCSDVRNPPIARCHPVAPWLSARIELKVVHLFEFYSSNFICWKINIIPLFGALFFHFIQTHTNRQQQHYTFRIRTELCFFSGENEAKTKYIKKLSERNCALFARK